MSNVFFTTGNKPRAIVSIRRASTGEPQTLNAAIPDGDTAGIHLQGSVSVRFLGVDSPEKQIDLVVAQGGNNLDSPQWESYLTNPFASQFGPFKLEEDLVVHLTTRIGRGAGAIHFFSRKKRPEGADRPDPGGYDRAWTGSQHIPFFHRVLVRGVRFEWALPGFYQSQPA